jgi:hypothetical protein
VLRRLVPAVYVPFAAVLAFGIIVAVSGIGSYEHIEQIGYLIGGSSYVLVFAHLASREMKAAKQSCRNEG